MSRASIALRSLIARVRRDPGQSLVEFVLVAPLLLLLLFGIIDFGVYLNQYDSDTNLAEMGARQAVVLGTSPTVPGTTCGTASDLYLWLKCEATTTGAQTPSLVCVYDTTSAGSYAVGDAIEVKVYSYFGWLQLVSIGASGGLSSTMMSTATMRNEQLGPTSFLTGTNSDTSNVSSQTNPGSCPSSG